MKALILAAFVITIGLASCSVTEPGEYYPRERVYSSSTYDPYYTPYDSRYSVRRVYDYNTGRYYDVPVYSAPVYSTPYPNSTYRNYRRDDYRRDNRRDNYRNDNYRRTYPTTQPVYQQPQVSQPKEKRYPDGTRVSPDGTVTLPNGQVKRSN